MCRLWCARDPALGEGVAQHPSLSVDLSTGLSSTLQAGATSPSSPHLKRLEEQEGYLIWAATWAGHSVAVP